MNLIGTVSRSQQNAGKFTATAYYVHKAALEEISIDALHIGPVPVIGVDPMAHHYLDSDPAREAKRVRTWGKIHAYLLDVLAINKGFSLWIRTSDSGSINVPDNSRVRSLLFRSTFYICTPNSICSIGAVQFSEDAGYEVWSPYIRNNLYNGGTEHYRKKSIHKKVALTSVRRYVRPIPAMEAHLPDWGDVIEEQHDAQRRRKDIAEHHLQHVYKQAATNELVALRRYQHAGESEAYVFQDGEILASIDNFLIEDAKLGDAINDAIEGSRCYQRIQIRQAPDSGSVSYQLTHIEVPLARSRRNHVANEEHLVYAEHGGDFRPIREIPDEVSTQISTLDFLGKDHRTKQWSEYVWVLNTGVMMEKGVLYYIPVARLDLG